MGRWSRQPLSFNSTLVQLKVIINVRFKLGIKSFNSTLVQLKDMQIGLQWKQQNCFNSTLVQLKVWLLLEMVVNLKVSILP